MWKGIIFVVIGVPVAILVHHGAFRQIKWIEGQIDSIYGIGLSHQGHYRDICNTFQTVDDLIAKSGENDLGNKKMGIYLTDPDTGIPPEQWQSFAGVSTSKDKAEIFQSKSLVSLEKAYVPAQKVLKTTFPYYSQLSTLLSVWKVYPAHKKYRQDNKITTDCPAIIEFYNYDEGIIEFYSLIDAPIFTKKIKD
eukprot:c12950_g1_i1.p1 GENE.c12950_g1_i1~~c12950_g1_i1.p1  ORF type:complete len:204 (-),score=70.62 c12950_g1_i1:75-653(-)